MKKTLRIYVLLLAVMLILSGCGGDSDNSDNGAPDVDWELQITGDVGEPLTLGFKDLAKMEQVELKDVLMEKSTGDTEPTSWSGVSIAKLFEQAGINEYAIVTAVAADGYAIEITPDEMENAIVALKDNGEWINNTTPDKGPIRLVTPQTPANRWVFQLNELRVSQ